MATKPAYYTVAASIVGTLDGAYVEYLKGEVVEADDPGLKKWPANFVPLIVRPITGKTDRVERATAAPGEKRE